jgi:histidinol-phosphatase
MLVAEGSVDIASEPSLQLYDMAACAVVVAEAGGRFSDLAGVDGPNGVAAVATNSLLHEEVLGLIGDGAYEPDGSLGAGLADELSRRHLRHD